MSLIFFYHHFYINQINYVNIIIKKRNVLELDRGFYSSPKEKDSTRCTFPQPSTMEFKTNTSYSLLSNTEEN